MVRSPSTMQCMPDYWRSCNEWALVLTIQEFMNEIPSSVFCFWGHCYLCEEDDGSTKTTFIGRNKINSSLWRFVKFEQHLFWFTLQRQGRRELEHPKRKTLPLDTSCCSAQQTTIMGFITHSKWILAGSPKVIKGGYNISLVQFVYAAVE